VSKAFPAGRLISAIVLAAAVSASPWNANATDIRHVVQDHAFGCRDKDEFSKIVELAHEHDNEAFGKLLFGDFATGACAELPLGAEVFVTGVTTMWAVVRLRGSTSILWTNKNAISPSN
jgi:hypothetical protein